ncbi:F-box/kelch-repeat protein At3g23880-like [Silene latifolia]|uniref:F-box/kelch-repeat protein At3g23880-like n=1 Tax=Silene latifolia TaxID=37657 RepID=UPI003D77EF41
MTKCKKKKQQTYLFDDLIFQEIIARLPIKYILRCMSVSKQWYSTISSSAFANAHLTKSPFAHPSAPVNTLFIRDNYRNKSYLFSYNDDDDDDDDDRVSGSFENNLVKLDFGKKQYLKITGCCNGLVCLTQIFDNYFVLWNPATRKQKKYESDRYLKRFDAQSRPYVRVSSGFGYASAVDDYKYVQILTLYWESVIIVHIFSLRENKWRKIDFGHDPLLIYKHVGLDNEKLYWTAKSSQLENVVVSFDLGNGRFDIIKMNWVETDVLGVMGGRLSKCNYRGDKIMHILEPPSILKSICLPKGLCLDMFSEMVGFTKADKFFVTVPSSGHENSACRTLGLVDTRRKPMQYTALWRFNMTLEIARYFPSVVSPFPMGEPSWA